MRTLRRPVALAAGLTMAAGLAVADFPSGGTPADAQSLLSVRLNLAFPPPPPPPPPAPPPASAPAPKVPGPPAEALAALRQCESGGSYGTATGNGYFGAYQFSADSWRSLGYRGLPHQAPPAVQDEAASRLWSRARWQPWPGCAAKLRLR